MLQLLNVFRHCLLSAKQALGLGHGSISHRCQGGKSTVSLRLQELGLTSVSWLVSAQSHTCNSRMCCSFKLSLGDKLLAWGYRYILDLEKEPSKNSPDRSVTTPALPVSQGPYLGLLQEWGTLLILDVCDLALLDLDMMAVRDHNILLRQ